MRELLFAAILSFSALPLQADAAVVEFEISLDGNQVSPPVQTPANGAGTLSFDTITKLLSINVSWQGLLSGDTKLHIHGPAAPGVKGPAQFSFNPPSPLITVVGPLRPQQEADLLAELYYLNVHTMVHGEGEIRGQITRRVVRIEGTTWTHLKALYE